MAASWASVSRQALSHRFTGAALVQGIKQLAEKAGSSAATVAVFCARLLRRVTPEPQSEVRCERQLGSMAPSCPVLSAGP